MLVLRLPLDALLLLKWVVTLLAAMLLLQFLTKVVEPSDAIPPCLENSCLNCNNSSVSRVTSLFVYSFRFSYWMISWCCLSTCSFLMSLSFLSTISSSKSRLFVSIDSDSWASLLWISASLSFIIKVFLTLASLIVCFSSLSYCW